MNKASVLMDVVEMMSNYANNHIEYVIEEDGSQGNAYYPPSFDALLQFKDYLQRQIEAEISAYETSQGM